MQIPVYNLHEDALQDKKYLSLIRHDLIHVKIFQPFLEVMYPIIRMSDINKKGKSLVIGECQLNLRIKKISLRVFLLLVFCTLADCIYEFCCYFKAFFFTLIPTMLIEYYKDLVYYFFRFVYNIQDNRRGCGGKSMRGVT